MTAPDNIGGPAATGSPASALPSDALIVLPVRGMVLFLSLIHI